MSRTQIPQTRLKQRWIDETEIFALEWDTSSRKARDTGRGIGVTEFKFSRLFPLMSFGKAVIHFSTHTAGQLKPFNIVKGNLCSITIQDGYHVTHYNLSQVT